MPIECENCSRCHKFGLPILPVRYAIGPEYHEELVKLDKQNPEMALKQPDLQARHGKGTPELAGKFRVTDKEGGSEIPLSEGTQYTLRLLRKGYVYVINNKDPIAPLRCYEISQNGLLTETTPSQPKLGPKDDKRDVACAAHKNLMTAGILTIPFPDEADIVWIAFSDVKWTPAVEKLHQDPAYRSRHMRKVKLSDWMKSADPQHEHAANIHQLDPKKPIIAEYASEHPEYRLAFSFSDAGFNQKAVGVDLARAAEELNKKMGTHFSQPPKDEELPTIEAFLLNRGTLTNEQRASVAASPFERFIEEIDRFYARAHGGLQKNTPYEGKGMILALDDPAGIAQDLNGLIHTRKQDFENSKQYRRRLNVSESIKTIHATVLTNIAKDEARRYADQASMRPVTSTITGKPMAMRVPLTNADQVKHDEIAQGSTAAVQQRYKTEWKNNYAPYLRDKNETLEDFQKDYEEQFNAHRKKFITPLAEAHAKWMESERMFQYFSCNFDSGKDDSLTASRQSEAYVELFSRCVGITAEQSACMDLYVKWLSDAPLDEKNLLWRALTLNQENFSTEIVSACSKLESTQKALASLVRNDDETVQEKDWPKAAGLLRTWAFTWWDIHLYAQEKLHAAFSIDAKSKEKELQRSREAFKEAQQMAEKLQAQREGILLRAMEAGQENLQSLGQAMAEDKIAHSIRNSSEYKQLQRKLIVIDRNIKMSEAKSMKRLIDQMKVPLGRAGQRPDSPNFQKVRTLLSVHNGTPPASMSIKGTARAVGEVMASRFVRGGGAYGWGEFSGPLSSLPDHPKAELSARLQSTMSRELLLESLLLEGQPLHTKHGFSRLFAGTLKIHALDAVGPGANVWHIERKYFDELLRLQALQKKQAQFEAQIAQAQSNADAARAQAKKAGITRDTLLQIEREKATSQAAHQEAINRGSREIARLRGDLKSRLDMVGRRNRVLSGMQHGWPIINGVIALWCFGSLNKALKQLGPSLGIEDKKYDEAVSTFYASGLVVVGAVAELSHKALSAPGVRSWGWADGLRTSTKVATGVRVIGTAASSVASLVFAYWDWEKRQEALDKGQRGWANAYGASTILGGATAIIGFFSLFFSALIPIAVGCALIYATVSTIIDIFSPNETQKWLESCYFGKSQSERFNTNWETYEIGEFKRLGYPQ